MNYQAKTFPLSGLHGISDRTLGDAFAFDGERCDRMVARVLERIAAGT